MSIPEGPRLASVTAPLLYLVGERQTVPLAPSDDIAEVVVGPAHWFYDHLLPPDGEAA
ncbi:hypothetical protein LWC34_05465 [Kibdelosporangium philippinense]|uniref:Uncharacterized protein n=1 Tax=Kibdelosporangium philippinense TaxID=211113 RepID=A0ABS8Z2W0_9PSEU|nr:hypothetical protein [Kibdelosporangium philippinense]MCE7002279.1 hypothetical protein [Kibdelosporangium philippinense]